MPEGENWIDECKQLANKVRAHCLRITYEGKSGHVGSMLSMADFLAVLYTRILNVDPGNPDWPQRDRLILSKGHGGGGLYATLAERGFFPKDWLKSYYKDDGKLMGHICHKVPGVEFSTGSLGHGLPVACGMAIAAKFSGSKHRVFAILSDGDVDEGSTNEAIMFAAQQKLDNLTVIFDYNKIQALGTVEEVLNLEPLTDRMTALRWAVREVDGHDVEQIDAALQGLPLQEGKPNWITAHTIKGKGISFLENTVSCHYGSVNDEQLAQAFEELGVSA